MVSSPAIGIGNGDALVVVDVQNDFLPGGALAVPDGDAVVAVLNGWIEAFRADGLPVVYSRDWHPADHCSFQSRGGPWPGHCIAGSHGAEFAAGLRMPEVAILVSKAQARDSDAYSAFSGTGLTEALRLMGVRRLFVGGLATDYCVLNTVTDALRLDFAVVVLTDGVRAVDVAPGDGQRALDTMRAAGARLLAGDPSVVREHAAS